MPREDRDYRSSRDDDERWRSYRARGREDEDEDRDALGRRRGGWFGEPERHAEISRRTFEDHARAFGLPMEGRGGGRARMPEDRGYRMRDEDRGYRSMRDEDRGYRMRDEDRGYRMREDERGGYRVRDEDRGYRMREDERRPSSWYDEVERRRSEGGRVMRDEDEDRYRMRGRDEDEERDRLGRRKGGWFGDPEGHSQAVRFGRVERDEGGYRARRDEDEDRGYMARGEVEDEDRDRLGRRRGGWFGDPEGHSEAARRRWDRVSGRE
ncbi:MAG TPA: hypothetical protein VHW23_36215 [Kofleriaceae bacterium]|jgi:hypothetical protein|nr:hypothetical protein [Kofleriaceae bacterium]